MKIRLKEDLPIDKKHGCLQGNVYRVIRKSDDGRRRLTYFISTETGEECAAYAEEYEIASE